MLKSAPVRHQESATTDAPAPVSSDAPRPEYPRPRLRRERWTNLNGTWRFAFDDDRGLRERWGQVPADGLGDGPFIGASPCRSRTRPLSGIGDRARHDVMVDGANRFQVD